MTAANTGALPLAGRALNVGLDQLVRRGLRGVWVRGALPAGPVVWAANHHSWWDGFVAGAVLAERSRPAGLLMDGDNLTGFGFLDSIGVIPAGQPRRALGALRAGRVLVIFPEAQLRPPGPLGSTAAGAGWLAERAPAALVPVAVRIVNRGHQHPEALVDIGRPVEADDLTAVLALRLRELDALILATDPRQPPAGFRLAVRGRSSWDERITGWRGRLRR